MVVDESILVSSASQVFSQSSTDARGTRARTRTWPPSCDGRSDAMRENSSPSGDSYNIANAMVVALSFAVGWLVGRKVGDGWVGGWLGWFMKVWMDGWLACGWCPGLSKGRFAWAVIEEFDGNKKMNIHFPPQNAMQSRPAGSRDAHSSAATHGREGGKVFLGQCWVHSVH